MRAESPFIRHKRGEMNLLHRPSHLHDNLSFNEYLTNWAAVSLGEKCEKNAGFSILAIKKHYTVCSYVRRDNILHIKL